MSYTAVGSLDVLTLTLNIQWYVRKAKSVFPLNMDTVGGEGRFVTLPVLQTALLVPSTQVITPPA